MTTYNYEDYLKRQAEGQKAVAKQNLDEGKRQIALANEQLEKDANTQIANARATGAIGAENRRIIDNMIGYSGGGTALQNQYNILNSTQSKENSITSALAKAKADNTNRLATLNTNYNNSLLNIDNNVKNALYKAKLDALVEAAKEKAAEEKAARKRDEERAYQKQQRDEQRAYSEKQALIRIQQESKAKEAELYPQNYAELDNLAANELKKATADMNWHIPFFDKSESEKAAIDKASKQKIKDLISQYYNAGKISKEQAVALGTKYNIPYNN